MDGIGSVDARYAPLPLGVVVAVVTYDEALRIHHTDNPPRRTSYLEVGVGRSVTSFHGRLFRYEEDQPDGPESFGWEVTGNPDQLPLGDFAPGRYGWMLSNPLRLPIPVRCRAVGPDGTRTHMQGVFRLPAAVEAAVVAQIGGES